MLLTNRSKREKTYKSSLRDKIMNKKSQLLEKIELDSPELESAKLMTLPRKLQVVAGFIHSREALRRLAGEDYNPQLLDTFGIDPDSGFPSLDYISILDVGGVWHRHNDFRKSDPRNSSETVLSFVSPINSWTYSHYYDMIVRHIPRLKDSALEVSNYFKRKRDEAWDYFKNEAQRQIGGKSLNDKSTRYQNDDEFLRTCVNMARTTMEGLYADSQASFLGGEILWANGVYGQEDPAEANFRRDVGEFERGMIKEIYGPIVCQQVPGEVKPFNLNYLEDSFFSLKTHLLEDR